MKRALFSLVLVAVMAGVACAHPSMDPRSDQGRASGGATVTGGSGVLSAEQVRQGVNQAP